MRTSIRTTAVAATVVALAGAGVAFAAWTTTGTGNGSATAGTSAALTVNVNTATGLFPTGSVSVPFTVTNTNPYSVTLTGATAGSFTVDAGHATCNVAAISGAPVTLTDTILPAATSASRNVVISMSNAATDACKGATFNFALTVSGASS